MDDYIVKNQTDIQREYNLVKSELQMLEKKRKNKAIYLLILLISIGVTLLCYSAYGFSVYEDGKPDINLFGVIISISIGVFIASIISIITYLFYEMRENFTKRQLIELEVITMQKNIEEDIFDNSLKLSYKYLDQYYNQTREQAQKGFLVTVCVAIFGAILIFSGIIAMFFGQTSPSYITCASGLVTEFISAIFFYLYNKTITRMSKYHNKLVYSQNISFALKVADSLKEEEQVKAKNIIVTELLKDINANIKDDQDNK